MKKQERPTMSIYEVQDEYCLFETTSEFQINQICHYLFLNVIYISAHKSLLPMALTNLCINYDARMSLVRILRLLRPFSTDILVLRSMSDHRRLIQKCQTRWYFSGLISGK